MKNIRSVVVLSSIAAGAVAANAQASLNRKFQLTSETRWGNAVLPAGEYSMAVESLQAPVRIFIQSAKGKTAAIAVAETSAGSAKGGSYRLVTVRERTGKCAR